MASNGCGMAGNVSRAWRALTGSLPPFEACCDEHDLAYEQVVTEADRAWADWHLRRCMAARGYPVLGLLFQVAVRLFGWWAVKRYKNEERADA